MKRLLEVDFAGGQVRTCMTGLMPATCKDYFTVYSIGPKVKAFLDDSYLKNHSELVTTSCGLVLIHNLGLSSMGD